MTLDQLRVPRYLYELMDPAQRTRLIADRVNPADAATWLCGTARSAQVPPRAVDCEHTGHDPALGTSSVVARAGQADCRGPARKAQQP